MAELRDSICRDLAENKLFAWYSRLRQPEELYIRTLYVLFIATADEVPHILSGDMPKEIIIEPFLIVGLIAFVRRVLVITMQAAKLTEQGQGTADAALAFEKSMIELGLLGFLVLMFVLSIYFLRRASGREELVKEREELVKE